MRQTRCEIWPEFSRLLLRFSPNLLAKAFTHRALHRTLNSSCGISKSVSHRRPSKVWQRWVLPSAARGAWSASTTASKAARAMCPTKPSACTTPAAPISLIIFSPGSFHQASQRDSASRICLQNFILIHIYFVQNRAKLAQDRRDRGLRFVAEMASRARIQSDIARPGPHVAGRGGLHKAPPGQVFILLSKCFERTPEEVAHNVQCGIARTGPWEKSLR